MSNCTTNDLEADLPTPLPFDAHIDSDRRQPKEAKRTPRILSSMSAPIVPKLRTDTSCPRDDGPVPKPWYAANAEGPDPHVDVLKHAMRKLPYLPQEMLYSTLQFISEPKKHWLFPAYGNLDWGTKCALHLNETWPLHAKRGKHHIRT